MGKKKKNTAAKRKKQNLPQTGKRGNLPAPPPTAQAVSNTNSEPAPNKTEQAEILSRANEMVHGQREQRKLSPRKEQKLLAERTRQHRRNLRWCAVCAVCIGLIGTIAATEIFWAGKSPSERVVRGMHELEEASIRRSELAAEILKAASSAHSGGASHVSVYQGTRSTATQFEQPLLIVIDLGEAASEPCETALPRLRYDPETNEIAYRLEAEKVTVQTAMRECIGEVLRSLIGEDDTKTYQVTETAEGLIILVSNTTDDIVARFAYIIEKNPSLETGEQIELLKERFAMEEVDDIRGESV